VHTAISEELLPPFQADDLNSDLRTTFIPNPYRRKFMWEQNNVTSEGPSPAPPNSSKSSLPCGAGGGPPLWPGFSAASARCARSPRMW